MNSLYSIKSLLFHTIAYKNSSYINLLVPELESND